LVDDFFDTLELLFDEWRLWDEVEVAFLPLADLVDEVPAKSCCGLAAAISAQLSVSAQTAPILALRNLAAGLIMRQLSLADIPQKAKAQP
jgi:hypothetical protein